MLELIDMPHVTFDNRKFGRRRALIHAFIVNKYGHRIPCIVRNISVGGALLEVEEPKQVPNRFRLVIDADSFEADCDIRHRTAHGVGIYFNDIRIARNGCDTRFIGPKLQSLEPMRAT